METIGLSTDSQLGRQVSEVAKVDSARQNFAKTVEGTTSATSLQPASINAQHTSASQNKNPTCSISNFNAFGEAYHIMRGVMEQSGLFIDLDASSPSGPRQEHTKPHGSLPGQAPVLRHHSEEDTEDVVIIGDNSGTMVSS